jgi:hypothetical protein
MSIATERRPGPAQAAAIAAGSSLADAAATPVAHPPRAPSRRIAAPPGPRTSLKVNGIRVPKIRSTPVPVALPPPQPTVPEACAA